MGFDVLYLPPIHPIGRTNRKGKNNAEKANVSVNRNSPFLRRNNDHRPLDFRPW